MKDDAHDAVALMGRMRARPCANGGYGTRASCASYGECKATALAPARGCDGMTAADWLLIEKRGRRQRCIDAGDLADAASDLLAHRVIEGGGATAVGLEGNPLPVTRLHPVCISPVAPGVRGAMPGATSPVIGVVLTRTRLRGQGCDALQPAGKIIRQFPSAIASCGKMEENLLFALTAAAIRGEAPALIVEARPDSAQPTPPRTTHADDFAHEVTGAVAKHEGPGWTLPVCQPGAEKLPGQISGGSEPAGDARARGELLIRKDITSRRATMRKCIEIARTVTNAPADAHIARVRRTTRTRGGGGLGSSRRFSVSTGPRKSRASTKFRAFRASTTRPVESASILTFPLGILAICNTNVIKNHEEHVNEHRKKTKSRR